MEAIQAFLKKKDVEISTKRYLIDAMGAMAQGLFCSLLIGTIINAMGLLFDIHALKIVVATVGGIKYTVGGLAMAMSGPAMAVAIGRALHCPPLVLYSLLTVGFATNALGGAGGPLAVLFVAIATSEIGKLAAGETKVDILVTPLVTIGVGATLAALWAPPLGKLAMQTGTVIMWATELQPFLMGILVSVLLALPYPSDFIGCHLRGLGPHRSCRRRCCSRLLGSDDWLCRPVLPGKWSGRPAVSRSWHIHAADAQHR